MEDNNKDLEELNRRNAEKQHDILTKFGEETNRYAVESAQQVVKALVLIKGAAGIAVLAFIGNLVTEGWDFQHELLKNVVAPMIYFSWGVVAAVLSIGLSYLTNYSIAMSSTLVNYTYSHPYVEKSHKSKCWGLCATVFHITAILAVLASVILFVKGIYSTANIITVM